MSIVNIPVYFPIDLSEDQAPWKSYSFQGGPLTLFQCIRLSTAICNIFIAFSRKSTEVKYHLIVLKVCMEYALWRSKKTLKFKTESGKLKLDEKAH